MKNIKVIGIIIFILAVLAAAGVFIYKDFSGAKQKQDLQGNSVEQAEDSGSAKNQTNAAAAEGGSQQGDITAILNDDELKAKMPDLSRPIEIQVELSEDVKNKAIAEIQTLSQGLKEDYDTLEGWIQLGLLRKLIGDYEGAKEAWEFVALIRSKSPVPFHNLGFLYWQHLRDFSKSEKNYLRAIENDPQDIPAYVDLSNVYYFNLKDSKKAKDILLKGLDSNPNNAELLSSLEDLKKRQ